MFQRIALVCLLWLSQIACRTGQEAGASSRTNPGLAIYQTHCISCHQHDGKGLLRGRRYAADFTDPAGVLSLPDEVLLQSVMEGKQGQSGRMPAFKPILQKEDVQAALTFIRSEFQAKNPMPTAEAP